MSQRLANWEPAFKHYEEFEKILDSLAELFGNCPECVKGGGKPYCIIHECCKQRANSTCTECIVMDACEKKKQSLRGIREIRAVGVDRWAEKMQKNVNESFCYLDEGPK